jgi:hypothetical protein
MNDFRRTGIRVLNHRAAPAVDLSVANALRCDTERQGEMASYLLRTRRNLKPSEINQAVGTMNKTDVIFAEIEMRQHRRSNWTADYDAFAECWDPDPKPIW